ncbi:hypothetical protein HUG15_17740 [Salicibibacter cibarius]|uniref:Electron transfer flavoprotein alpha/beta-subunit N-terminal domain-containing protein n=2 Tax=Salicibibacter cibarius TaxID=2743000 RepID=A0A7T6Z5E9_9BACI|nr:hypothetical protein HUG15_17740 [Salicibibacter cibarius]
MDTTLATQDVSVENIRRVYFEQHSDAGYVAEADSIAALHFALSICGKGDTVTAVSFGGLDKNTALEYALAYGVTSLIRIEDNRSPETLADPTVKARSLAAWLENESFDIVICGNPSGTGVTPALMAGYLGIPCVSRVYAGERRSRRNREHLELQQRLERGWRQHVSVHLPALMTVQAGFFSPMYISVKRRQEAEKQSETIIQVVPSVESGNEKAVLNAVDPPKPRAKRKAMPDANQNAANRLQSLMGGGGGGSGSRAGQAKKKDEEEKVRELAPEKAAEEIVEFLKKKELLPESSGK